MYKSSSARGAARACIETRGLPGKCHRNAGIGASAPRNFSGGPPSPFIRKDYEVAQLPPTDAYPERRRHRMGEVGMGHEASMRKGRKKRSA